MQFRFDTCIMSRHGNHQHLTVIDVLNHLHTIHFWHFDVHHHHRRLLIVKCRKGFRHMMVSDYLPRITYQTAQHLLQQLQLQRIVVQNENLVVSEIPLRFLLVFSFR